jgi:hypothetical protein
MANGKKRKLNMWTRNEEEMSGQNYTYNGQLHTRKRKQAIFIIQGHLVET